MDLFGPNPREPREVMRDDERNSWMMYYPRFLSGEDLHDAMSSAGAMVDSPEAMVLWRREAHHRFARAVGDARRKYRYAGIEQVARPWPAWVEIVRDRAAKIAECPFDFALMNYYEDGAGALGWHSDKEADLFPGAPIASLSLGAERDFQWRLAGESTMGTLTLESGSLLVMGGETQRYFEHQVPVRSRVDSGRLNITFRRLRAK